MIRDVIVHLHNEQPLLADLPAPPTAGDTCLVCTNLRATNGKAPVFVGSSDSTFVFPLAHVRFIEIRAASVDDQPVVLLPETTGVEADPYDELAHMDADDDEPEPVDLLRRLLGN
jgi:hypothetical protein